MEKTCLASIEPELKDLIQRVLIQYKNPKRYLEQTLDWLSEPYSRFKGYYTGAMDTVLKEKQTEQVVAISNSGLWLGAIAKSLGHDVRILDVHRPLPFRLYKRHGPIHWYYITPKIKCSDGCKIYDLTDTSTIIQSEKDIKDVTKMGVIDFDKIEKGQRTVIVDADLDEGVSMAVAHRRVLDLGANVVGKIVISKHSKMPGVRALDELKLEH